ncbi:MAG: MFS transporter [Dehalococcoidia bacterium]|nr:MFS transporter [Dehalococcoidia bacterium]MDD5494558.1 MFS transporter [Dehalococcoidia bacterium]
MKKKLFGLSPNIIFIGIISFLTDVSSELIFTLMPLFLANVLGAATVVIGLIEGVAESTASLLKLVSGWLSDKLGNRKYLSFVGYAFSSLSKPFMLIAGAWGPIMAIRFADRLGKGIRASPRDALVGDSVDEDNRGKAYGFHKAMDTSGAALGLLIAAVIVFLLQRDVVGMQFDTYRWMIIIGIVPAFMALFFFIFIKEPPRKAADACAVTSTGEARENGLGRKFKIFLVIMFLFTLGNSSDAFVILRAQDLGNSVLIISLMLIMFNIIYALFSMPAGIISDRLGRRKVIIAGWIIYTLVYMGLAVADQAWMIWVLTAFYGLYYGLTQGVARALVCDLVPEEHRGTAFGMYNGVVGITLLPASLIAGWLWQTISPAAPFYFGATLAAVAAIGLLVFVRE